MNDDELITTVRESFTGVHSITPVEQIVSRRRALRARRRIPGLAAALAVVAGAVVAVTTLLPASHQASNQPGVQLAAWTVVKQADGTVSVTIRELRDLSRPLTESRSAGARQPAVQRQLSARPMTQRL